MSSFNGHVGPLAITTDGLVGCWDAASKHSYPGSGTTWKDISGQGNDASATGGPIFVNQYGGYFYFEGTDERFDYDLYSGFDNAYIQSISVSVEIWVRMNDLSSCCGAFWAFGGAQFEWAPYYSNTAAYVVGGTPTWMALSGGANTGQWYCYTVTHVTGGTTYKLYVDGVLDSTHTPSGNPQFTTGTGTFGTNNPLSGSYFDGDIAVVRMYKRALTAAEVKHNYDSTKVRFR